MPRSSPWLYTSSNLISIRSIVFRHIKLRDSCLSSSGTRRSVLFLLRCKPDLQPPPLALALAMETFHLSFPLPRSLEARIYVHLNIQSKSVMIFLTTASADELGTPPPMGSFVYALPDVSCCWSFLRRDTVIQPCADCIPFIRSSTRVSRSPPRCMRLEAQRNSQRGWRGCSQRRPSYPSMSRAP